MKVKPGLLDISMLIALIDPAHEFHDAAHTWFRRHRSHGWATCPITENGCVRIMSGPGYPFPGLTVERVRDVLGELAGLKGHVFWADSVSVLEPNRFDFRRTRPKHVTDLYLLSLAKANGGRLVTFDRTIPCAAVNGYAAEDIEVLGA
jgi:toxin-antitoxin system PIN domain toxin